jgi:hypothetical protein
MRRCITRTLIAGAAAAAGALALAAAALAGAASTTASVRAPHTNPPSGGPPVYTAPCPFQAPVLTAALIPAPTLSGCSGYQASGRDFRFVQAVITVPTTPCAIGSPMMYIALAGGDSYARAGIECGSFGGPVHRAGAHVAADGAGNYHGFFEVLSQGATTFSRRLDTVSPGDGVFFSIYFNQAGNADQFTGSGPGVSAARTVDVGGPVYNRAYALADWILSLPPTPAATPLQPGQNTPVQSAQSARVTRFLQGRFTTASGHRGTFEGPWKLRPVEVTSNGFAPPGGTLISVPSHLWTDTLTLSGKRGDAFSVWLWGNGVTQTQTQTPL